MDLQTEAVPSTGSSRHLVLRWLILVLLAILLTEALAAVGIWIANARLEAPILRTTDRYREQSARILALMDSHNNGGRTVFDGRLGWAYRAGHRAPNDRISLQGLRSDRTYSAAPAEGVLRVAAFGDSFVYSTETGNDGSWTHLMESSFSELEVLNYGVGAYGTGQAYLRFTSEGRELSPDVVIIGFAPVMLSRTVSVYRRFLAPNANPLVKPRFLLENDDLVLVPSPLVRIDEYERYLSDPGRVIELATHDHWYRPIIYENPIYDLSATVRLAAGLWIRLDNRYFNADRMRRGRVFNAEAEAFRVQVALIERFADEVRSAGMTPLFVVFPAYGDIVSGFSGAPGAYMPLVERVGRSGIDYVDLMDAFVQHSEEDIDDWFRAGHYTEAANRIVAERLGTYLTRRYK